VIKCPKCNAEYDVKNMIITNKFDWINKFEYVTMSCNCGFVFGTRILPLQFEAKVETKPPEQRFKRNK